MEHKINFKLNRFGEFYQTTFNPFDPDRISICCEFMEYLNVTAKNVMVYVSNEKIDRNNCHEIVLYEKKYNGTTYTSTFPVVNGVNLGICCVLISNQLTAIKKFGLNNTFYMVVEAIEA